MELVKRVGGLMFLSARTVIDESLMATYLGLGSLVGAREFLKTQSKSLNWFSVMLKRKEVTRNEISRSRC